MDLASATEREALVGDRPEEVVPEAQRVRSLPGHELAEPAPAVEVADVLELVREDVSQQVELELGAEHGRVPQQEAIARLQGVDPRRDQASPRSPAGRRDAAAGRGDELADEQRVAAGALGDLSEQLLGEGELAGSRQRQPGRLGRWAAPTAR